MDMPALEKRKFKLKQFTFAELLNVIPQLYGQIFPVVILPVILLVVPTIILQAVSQQNLLETLTRLGIDPTDSRATSRLSQAQINQLLAALGSTLWPTLLLTLLITLVFGSLMTGVITHQTSERYLGRAATLGQTWTAIRGRLLPYVFGQFIYALILVGLLIALSLILFACGLGFGVLGYIALTLGSLLAPVLILENVSVGMGMRRAWSLAKKRFWMIAGIVFVSGLLSVGGGLVIGLFFPTGILLLILSGMLTIFITPIIPIAATLIYYDSRVRFEDLEGAFSASSVPEPRPADVYSPKVQGALMEGSDFTNMALLTAGIFVIALVLVGLTFLNSPGVSSFAPR